MPSDGTARTSADTNLFVCRKPWNMLEVHSMYQHLAAHKALSFAEKWNHFGASYVSLMPAHEGNDKQRNLSCNVGGQPRRVAACCHREKDFGQTTSKHRPTSPICCITAYAGTLVLVGRRMTTWVAAAIQLTTTSMCAQHCRGHAWMDAIGS